MYRIMIFVDDRNFTKTAQRFDVFPNLIKLRDFLANENDGRDLLETVVYIGYPPEVRPNRESKDWHADWQRLTEKNNRRKEFFEHHGIMVVKRVGKDEGNGLFDADVDVVMAMETIEFALECKPDIVVLVTGDADFALLASKLRRRGIRVEVAAVEKPRKMRNLSPELARAANQVIELSRFFETLHEEKERGEEDVREEEDEEEQVHSADEVSSQQTDAPAPFPSWVVR